MSHIGQHSDARSLARKAKKELELKKALQEAEAKLINEKKYREAMMAEALRKLTPKEMEQLGITIIYGEKPDPNATPSLPNYMRPTTASSRRPTTASSRRPTTASSRRSRQPSFAKGGRRTRKRRNGKKKTMRKGGRMRRHHSRNKR